jgi:acyl-CoA synthetase
MRTGLANDCMTLLTLQDPGRAREYYRKGLWFAVGFYDLVVNQVRERPNHFAMRDSKKRLTWLEVERWTRAISKRLEEAGLRPGDRVSMALSNRVEALIIFLACSRNGFVCNPSLHRNYTTVEMKALLTEIGSAAVFYERGWNADNMDLLQPGEEVPGLLLGIPLEANAASSRCFPSPTEVGAQPEPIGQGADKVCYLAFTSGTTGRPKGVMHSDNTILANARDMVTRWGLDERTTLLSLSPISHHIAWVGFAQAVLAGAEFVLDDPGAGSRLDWVRETEATYVMGVPTHAMDLLSDQRDRGLGRMGSIKTFYMAGAPIPKTVAESFIEQGITPQNVYGMTENSSHQFTHPDDTTETIVGTCGKGGPAYEVQIFDPDDNRRMLPPGEVGEIGGRGAALMLGYFGDQKSTEGSFNGAGWFMSGDLGRLDSEGNLEIVGRLKDIIIRGGRNILPAKIENLTIRHPLVEKAAAIAVSDPRLGEKVCLVISCNPSATPAAEEVLSHLNKQGLSKYDMPEFFAVVNEFPLTASGKILKRELSEQVKQGSLSPLPVRFSVT